MKLTAFVSVDSPGSVWNGRTQGLYYLIVINSPVEGMRFCNPMIVKSPHPSIPTPESYQILPNEILETFTPHLKKCAPDEHIILFVSPRGKWYDSVLLKGITHAMADLSIEWEDVTIRYAVQGIDVTHDISLDDLAKRVMV